MKSANDKQLLEKYRSVLAIANMGIWEWDLVSETLSMDQGMQRLYGFPPEITEVNLQACMERIHPDDLESFKAYVMAARHDDLPSDYMVRIISFDNKIKYIRTMANKVWDSKGGIISIMGLSWDVTEETELKKQKEKTESQFQLMISLIDSSADLLGFCDSTGIPSYVNKAGQDIYGIIPGEMYFSDYVAIKDLGYMKNVVVQRLRSNLSWEGEVAFVNPKTKEQIPLWVRIFSIRTGPGPHDIFYGCSGSDLRKLKSIQNSLIMQSKMAALGEMAAEMAHEINNPLMIIQVKAQMIQERLKRGEVDAEKIISDLKMVENNGARIQKIVYSSKAISRNAETDPFTSVSLLTLIDEAFEIFQERFSKKHLHLIRNVEPGLSYNDMVEGRGSEILQVFVNLIKNSYDAIRNQENGQVEFKVLKKENTYEILVTDTGDRIPKDISEKMMNPFFTTKPTGESTGLGLSISKQIIENHHGRLIYDAEYPKTRFVVTLKKKINSTATV